MKRALTIGSAMQDLFLHHDQKETLHLHTCDGKRSFIILEEGKKVDLTKLTNYPGGGGLNSAVSFTRLGFSVSSFFKVGDDFYGNYLLQHARKEGIHIDSAIKSATEQTGISFILPCPSGNRSVLIERGANVTITEDEIPLKAIDACDFLYITSLNGQTAKRLPFIAQYTKDKGKLVAVNPGTNQLVTNIELFKQSLANIDILILNRYEASLLAATLQQPVPKSDITIPKEYADRPIPQLLKDPPSVMADPCFVLPSFVKEVFRCGPSTIAITNGAEGVYAATQEKIYFHPSLPETVVSTLGAGDAFGSTFVAQLMLDQPLETAIRAGIINSTSVIAHLDTQTGLLSHEKLNKKLEAIDPRLLMNVTL